MEAYFSKVSKTSRNRVKARNTENDHEFMGSDSLGLNESFRSMPSSQLTKHLLDTLSNVSNPITHSDISERTVNVVPFLTGHQVAETRRNTKLATADRESKLSLQRGVRPAGDQKRPLHGTKIYVNGYLQSTTDIEVKRLVVEAGGEIVATLSQCTHIVTSQRLSASKMHDFLSGNSRSKRHVVSPRWVFDSVSMGRRRAERSYAIASNANTLCTFLKKCK